jgi:hypothetical protein
MALTTAQVESVREMVGGETFTTIQTLCGDLNSAQETAMIADITLWESKKNKVALRMKGGRDGIDLENERLLKAVQRRVRLRLNLPISSGGGISRIAVEAYGCE